MSADHEDEDQADSQPERSVPRGRRNAPQSAGSTAALSAVGVAMAAVCLLFTALLVYQECRVNVPPKHAAVLIHKTGKDLANGDEVAPSKEYKGVQREVLTEGRYFFNPLEWDWQIVEQVEVPAGKLGVRVRLVGEELPHGQLVVETDEQKGIVADVLRPGRYAVNPYVEMVELHEPINVPPGFKGVVTNLSGPLAEDPNVITVPEGCRGVMEVTKEPGTYYVNPYVTRISLVDCRSQRFNLAENKDMGFPSKDGFFVSLDGVIEFRVKPEMAAQVYVEYNEFHNGEAIEEELIRKAILPNARSFCRLEGSNSLGRDFIQGTMRTQFQEKFQQRMRDACDSLGIEIIQALITKIYPPEQIADAVRDREIAKQQEKQYQQQILQQESEIKLAIEKMTVDQKKALVQADQEVISVTTKAIREQEVAVTKANQEMGVAKFKLDAAKDEAAAILSRGKAAAQVVELENAAEAAGWNRAVEAFNGDGSQYAQYVLFEKLAGAYRNMMVNTADSPIMKIFESFNNSATSAPKRQLPPSAAPATAAAAAAAAK